MPFLRWPRTIEGFTAHAAERPFPIGELLRTEETGMKSSITDGATEESVRRELERDPSVDGTHIAVTASDGAVVLLGRIDSYAEKVRAVKAAERVYGVRAVADQLEVKPSAPRDDSDQEIAETIAPQLSANSVVPDTVEADVRNGFVTLRGM
ncbi:MAG: BON domain-containing protein, partial [Acidimicrobiales bacterium]|nr:BON domain-containing protein [Acidimicrobiales bacterium]